jgi:outer membrane protein assembly factor BamB
VRVLAVLLLASVAAADDWPCARGNLANTGVTKNKGPVAKPAVAWEHEEKDAIGTGAALDGHCLVYGVGEYVVACRKKSNGMVVWDAGVKQQVKAWPAICGDFAYCGSPDRVHYVLKMADGKEPAGFEAEGEILADPAVTEEYYVAGSMDGILYVLSPKEPRAFWRAKTGPVRHGAALDGGRAYVANTEGVLFALDLRDKRELWKLETKATPQCAPILAKASVLLVLPDEVLSVSVAKGALERRHATKGIAGAPALDGATLYWGTAAGEVACLDLKTGKEAWRTKVAEVGISSPLVLANKVLYGAAGSTLFAADAKGKLVWTYEGEAEFRPPIVADKSIYVGAGDRFYCLR